MIIKYYNYTIKAIRKGGRVQDNKAERLSKPQDILSRVIKEDDIGKNKIDKFKNNLAKVIKQVFSKSQQVTNYLQIIFSYLQII